MRRAHISFFSAERPSLDQFVLLSMMLHVLAIVLFGDPTGGGARRGEKLWGALTVTVQGLLPERGTELKLDRGATLLQPGRGARPAPASPAISAPKRDDGTPAASEATQAAEQPAPAAQTPSFAMPPLISKEVEKAETEFVVPKPSTDRAHTPAPPTSPAAPAEAAAREAPAVPPPPTPVIATPAPEPVAPPKIERAVPPPPLPAVTPVEPKPRDVPVAPPQPEVVTPPPKVEREVVKPVVATPEPKPREVAPTPVVPAPPAAPPPVPVLAPTPAPIVPAAPAVEVKPRELPAAPPPAPVVSEPAQRTEAAKVEREVAPPPAQPVAPKAAAPREPAGTPAGTPNAPRDLLAPRGDSATPSTDAKSPGKAPAIDLDAIRRRAREINSEGTGPRTVFPFPASPPQKPKSKEQQAFDKALKSNDCRDKYADMGLAAVVPLVLSAVREDGCKW